MNRPSAAYSSAHAVATNVMQVAGVIVTTAIMARLLGPEGKGVYDLYATCAALLSTALALGVPSGIVHVISSKRANLIALASYMLAFALLCGIVAFAIVSVLSKTHFAQDWLPMRLGSYTAALVALGAAALAASLLARSFLTGQRFFLQANYGDIFKQVAGIILLVLAFGVSGWLHWPLLVSVVGANIVTVFATVLCYLAFADLLKPGRGGPAGIKACFAFALPCYGATFLQYLNYRMDVFFVSTWHGTGQVGVYQVGVVIAQAINMVPSTVQGVLFPAISAAHSDGQSRASQVAQANRLLILASALLGAILFLVAPFLIRRLYGAAFGGGAVALQILIPGCTAFVAANVLAGFFAGIGKPQLNLLASTIGFVITLALDLCFIPKWGFVGAAWASTISYASTAFVTVLLFRRETHISFRSLFVPRLGDALIIKGIIQETRIGRRLLAGR